MLSTTLGRFRLIATLEGMSFLFLLFIAMPLKYVAGYPLVVKYTGWVHGVLFVQYCIFLFMVWSEYSWSFFSLVKAFLASLIPFGTFYMDREWKKIENK